MCLVLGTGNIILFALKITNAAKSDNFRQPELQRNPVSKPKARERFDEEVPYKRKPKGPANTQLRQRFPYHEKH